jgi:hypothetical protein
VSYMIPPIIQMSEMSHPLRVPWSGPGKVEQEAESLKVLTDVLDSRVSGVERKSGRELCLDRGPHGGGSCRGAELDTFGVEIPTKTLKMPADEHHVAL